jgi:hypothetical protein
MPSWQRSSIDIYKIMYLLRRIRNSSQWADMWEDPLWETPEDCPPSAIWQLYEARKPDGALSVWRVKTDEDMENVAAADALQKGAEKGELQDIAYLELAEDYLIGGAMSSHVPVKTTPTTRRKTIQMPAVTSFPHGIFSMGEVSTTVAPAPSASNAHLQDRRRPGTAGGRCGRDERLCPLRAFPP